MEKIAFDESYYFPTKKQMLTKINLKPVEVVSNHFKVDFSKQTKFDEWHMRIFKQEDKQLALSTPDVLADAVPSDSRSLISEIVMRNKRTMISTIGGCFHTGVTLFSFSEKTVADRQLFDCHDKFLLFIERKNSNMDFGSLQLHANSGARMQMIRFLNSFVKNCLKTLNYHPWGRNLKYYNIEDFGAVEQHHLTVFKGYATSVDMYEGGLKMLVDYSTRIIRDDNLIEELKYYEVDMKNKEAVKDFVVGKSFMANYGNNRIYRADDVAFDLKITSPFKDPKFKNYEDYYMQRYRLPKFRHRDQFLVIHYSKRWERDAQGNEVQKIEKIELVPELLLPTGLTDEMKANFNVMKDIGQHTIVRPDKRFPLIQNFTERINREAANNRDFNFRIDPKSNKITGYSLKPPIVRTGNSNNAVKGDTVNLEKVKQSVDLNNWLFFHEKKNERDVDLIVDQLKKASARLGVKVNEPNDYIILPFKVQEGDLERMISRSKGGGKPNMLFFFVSKGTAKFLYKNAKKYLQRKGIASQFFVSFNPNKDKNNLAKFGKLVTQMVDKLGGKLWEVEINMNDTIIAGADVFHGPRARSVSALVTTSGKNFENYFTAQKSQRKGVEIMHNMSSMVLASVQNYVERYKVPPKQYIFYRDGVGEGQLSEVQQHEIKKIKTMLVEKYGSQAPKLLFVVVTKRISDRFAINSNNGLSNPVGGLLVCEDVVKANHANFFLVAQRVTQGTATPTHYEVVYNDTAVKLESLYDLTYQLTFTYTNWTGAVKVPGVVQHAHKLAGQIGITQDDVVEPKLAQTKHYL